jgi:hypothetical protein
VTERWVGNVLLFFFSILYYNNTSFALAGMIPIDLERESEVFKFQRQSKLLLLMQLLECPL